MNYAFICTDDGDQSELRSKHLIEHLRYVESNLDKVVIAGPCAPSDPKDKRQFQGSIMVYKAETETIARALFEGDPYVKNGVWAKVRMMPFNPVAGVLLGGQTWVIEGDQARLAEPHGL
ncbi:MAG: YciI family protein [Rhodospirillaceae bacterium]